MKADGRLTANEVFAIKDDVIRKGTTPIPQTVVALCTSHEKYRALCQEFLDIYAGRGAKKVDDDIQARLFGLFLKIVGGPPPA
jgi:hypothetical protein